MEILFILVIGVVIGFYIKNTFGSRFLVGNKLSRKETEYKRKNDILVLFKNNDKITNNDVEKELNVSDSTATRYLQKLEDDKKIKQVGEVGSGVYYELI